MSGAAEKGNPPGCIWIPATVIACSVAVWGEVQSCERREERERVERERRMEEQSMVRTASARWSASVKDAQGVYLPPDAPCEVVAIMRSDGTPKVWTTATVRCGALTFFDGSEIRASAPSSPNVSFCAVAKEPADGGGTRYALRCQDGESRRLRSSITAKPALDLDSRAGRVVVSASQPPMRVELVLERWSEAVPGKPIFD